LPLAARRQIEEYVERFEDTEQKIEALGLIREHLERLAANPKLGSTPPGGFGFPIYGFRMRIGGVGYHVRVAYCYSQDEQGIIILGLGQQLL